MQRDFESQAEACSNKKRHRRIWKRIVGTLACVVVFCTTYALILPAITMEGMKCGMEEHTHSMDCYVKNEPEVLTELSCSPESLGCHVHSDSCKDADGNIICGYADYIIHTHNDNCYDSKGNRICELEEIEEHVHTDECYKVETITSQESAAEETANTAASEDNTTVKKTLVCTKEAIEEHKHTEECYDEDNNLICGKLETIKHVHEDSCFQKTEEAIRAETLTCGLKESDEHQHTALCYGDWELVCGLEEHTHTEECYPEEETETTDDESADTNAEVSEEVQNVITLIDEMPSADEIDAKMKKFEDAEDYEGEEAWLTEVYQQVAKAYYYYDLLSDEEKELVSNADKLLELEYIWSVTEYVTSDEVSSITSATPTTVDYASTRDFIELNLYDFYGSANASSNGKEDINNLWNNVGQEYPGFQWNGGAYPYKYWYPASTVLDWTADRNIVDCIDFGNSMITDYKITSKLYTPDFSTYWSPHDGSYKGDKSSNAQLPAYADGSTGKINRLVVDTTGDKGVTNRPIGITSDYGAVVSNILGSDGYPKLAANNASLKYLFTESEYAEKKNTVSIEGLFQQDTTSGEYFFNSRANHAQYSNNQFTLYNQMITPNFLLYPFGNFLPFSDINADTTTQVSAFNYEGGVKDYIQTIIDRLVASSDYNSTSDYTTKQLAQMLTSYRENWKKYTDPKSSNSRKWSTITAADALNDFFNNADEPSSATVDFAKKTDLLKKLYNIDYDVEKNFFFGMEMKMEFMMPVGGKTGNDTDGDGKSDYDMEFYFTGDDDVWVYIDDVLFLDLSGIHRHVGGKIDFVNGTVSYYQLNSAGDGEVYSDPYVTYSFAEILSAAGKTGTINLNSKGTFEDYSFHTFNFYYMERGSGSSVCSINFNFPLLRQNNISVEKVLSTDTDITALGNPDFKFQVLQADTDGNATSDLFIDKGIPYTLYDANGQLIQEVTEIRHPNGNTETIIILYDEDGEIIQKITKIVDSKGNVTQNTIVDKDGNVMSEDKTIKTDENGIFTLKAGQKAEFVGIDEDSGSYIVRELLEGTIDEQYGEIYVSGTAVTKKENIPVGEESFTGVDSPAKDISDGSTSFIFTNKVDTDKLGSLTITKKLTVDYSGNDNTNKEFVFNVTLDGELLAKGTSYVVKSADGTTTTKAVETAGQIILTAGQTATISNILAGTEFKIIETTESASGYIVDYTVGNTSQGANGASGIIEINKVTAITVTNSENGDKVQIRIKKSLYAYDQIERTYEFQLNQVTVMESEDGSTISDVAVVTGGTSITMPVDINTGSVYTDYFTLSYQANKLGTIPATFYYRITEAYTNTDTKKHNRVYVIKVVVSKTEDGKIDANVESIWTTASNASATYTKTNYTESVPYVNTVIDSLTIGKTVSGGTIAKEKEYTFTITLTKGVKNGESVGSGSGAALNGTYSATRTNADGTTVTEKIEFTDVTSNDNTVKFATVTLQHGETLTINNIPIGTTWSVEETVPDNFDVTSNGGTTSGAESVTGTIVAGGSTATFVNTELYELPESGGTGTFKYTMAGLLLLCSAAYLLYRQEKRRKEVR